MATPPPQQQQQPPPPEEPVEEEPSEPLKYKTWSLKVSVHCEGCKRKVKKILLGIEGVYTVDVDTKLHKATVTANVDPEILIRKLEKSGKHAELWPDKSDQRESKRNKKKKKNNKKQPNEQDNNNNNPENNDNNVDSPPTEPDKPDPNKIDATTPVSKTVEVINPAKSGGNVQFKEVRVETVEQPDNKPPDGAASGGGGGGGGKKKNRKGKGNGGGGNANGSGNGNGGEPASNGNGDGGNDGGPPCGQAAPMQGQGPPGQMPRGCYPVYEHPPGYYGPPPVYAVSYNTAYPASSYTASYYANPAPYAASYYVQQGGSDSAEGGPPDTFEMFSDENPNACAVM